MTFSDDIEEPL